MPLKKCPVYVLPKPKNTFNRHCELELELRTRQSPRTRRRAVVVVVIEDHCHFGKPSENLNSLPSLQHKLLAQSRVSSATFAVHNIAALLRVRRLPVPQT